MSRGRLNGRRTVEETEESISLHEKTAQKINIAKNRRNSFGKSKRRKEDGHVVEVEALGVNVSGVDGAALFALYSAAIASTSISKSSISSSIWP